MYDVCMCTLGVRFVQIIHNTCHVQQGVCIMYVSCLQHAIVQLYPSFSRGDKKYRFTFKIPLERLNIYASYIHANLYYMYS